MTKGKKPKSKHVLEIHFDTKTGLQNFIAWYLDGGGEQQSNYYTQGWGKDWMHVKAPDDACPYCEFVDDSVQSRGFENRDLAELQETCTNCNMDYIYPNPYCES